MRILNVVPWVVITGYGGVPAAMWKTVELLLELDHKVDVVATGDITTRESGLPAAAGQVGVYCFPTKSISGWCYSPRLNEWLRANASKYDLIYIHGVWPFPNCAASYWARRAGKPYIIQPHGELNSWCRRQKRAKKLLHYRVWSRRMLRHAGTLVATGVAEAAELEHLRLGAHIAIVPLPVPAVVPAPPAASDPSRPLRLLFLGRIDPKKNLPVLLEALAMLKIRGVAASLTIAGTGDTVYTETMQHMVVQLGLRDTVAFVGWIDQHGKESLFATHDVFVLTSHNENFGIAVAEAAAAGIAVVVSDQVALADDLRTAGAGLVVPVGSPARTADAIAQLANADLRASMGARGRALAHAQWSSAAASRSLAAVCTWVMKDVAQGQLWQQSDIKAD